MRNKIIILLFLGLAIVAAVIFFQTTSFGTQALWAISNQGKWLLPLISVAALIDSVNPCAFSILLLTVAFLFSIGRLRKNILAIGGFYIFGVFTVYLLIGLGIFRVLHLFDTPHFMAKIGAVLLLVLGVINILGALFPNFPLKISLPFSTHRPMARLMEKGSLIAAFLLGALVGLCEFPCTGGPYLMAVGLLHDRATFLSGLGYLILYNLIFVLPLVVILFFASDHKLLEKVQAWQQKDQRMMRLISGIAMILLAIIVSYL